MLLYLNDKKQMIQNKSRPNLDAKSLIRLSHALFLKRRDTFLILTACLFHRCSIFSALNYTWCLERLYKSLSQSIQNIFIID